MPANEHSKRPTKPSKDSGVALQGCGLATLCNIDRGSSGWTNASSQNSEAQRMPEAKCSGQSSCHCFCFEQVKWILIGKESEGMWTCCINDEGEHAVILLTWSHDLWLLCTARSIRWTTAIKAKSVGSAGTDTDPVLASPLLYIDQASVSDVGVCRRRCPEL